MVAFFNGKKEIKNMSLFDNLDDREKAAYLDSIRANLSTAATYINAAGDTMTGLLNLVTLTSTSTASLASANIPTFTGATIALTSLASLSSADIPTLTSASAGSPAVTVRKTVAGNLSIGTLRISGISLASGAVLEFYEKGFASITSVVLTTVANTDYAVRVQVGSETRWIPLFKDAAMIGMATFS